MVQVKTASVEEIDGDSWETDFDGFKSTIQAAAGEVVVIAIMGMTGSGKSTFIRLATGRDDVRVGESLASCV